ncbi:ISAs1 family transposase [Streptomyces sp. NPDC046984]|uniref:ISAs1 family transposase n=1 Tax=Streptomyces sp. NPDC046984 TaxID=3155138 RepID=UPI0033CAC60C
MPSDLEELARIPSPQPLPDAACLVRFLAGLPDPRDCRGRRFPLTALVAAAAAGVLAGARSLTAIAEWTADAPPWALRALGFTVDPFTRSVAVPHATTVMRLLGRLDGDAFDNVICTFLQARAHSRQSGESRRWRAVAVDGKQLRGSRAGGGKAVWLLAAMDHAGTVIAQRQIDAKSNETPAFIPLLDGLPLENTVVTADAAHTQHANGQWLRNHGAHYIAVVKGNHPSLLRQLRKLPWHDIGLDHKDRTRGRGRLEVRHLKTVTFQHLDYPGARQALRVMRWRMDLTSKKITIERLYFVTSPARSRHRRTARQLDPRALEDREPAPPRPRHDLHRGRLHHPDRQPAPRDGKPPQPRDQCVPPGRSHQHRRRLPPHRTRPTTTPDSPRDQVINQTDQLHAMTLLRHLELVPVDLPDASFLGRCFHHLLGLVDPLALVGIAEAVTGRPEVCDDGVFLIPAVSGNGCLHAGHPVIRV